MQYDIKTNKTTPYWNCPTVVLEKKVETITKMIERVNTVSGNELNYLETGEITSELIELRRTIKEQIEYRNKADRI